MPDFSRITRRSDRHLYQQIAQAIEDAIVSGELAPGDPVPSERYLTGATGASRWAVRHALADLRERGIVYTVADRGSFIAERPPDG